MYKNHDTHDNGTYCISLIFLLPLNNTDMCKLTQHIHRVYFVVYQVMMRLMSSLIQSQCPALIFRWDIHTIIEDNEMWRTF